MQMAVGLLMSLLHTVVWECNEAVTEAVYQIAFSLEETAYTDYIIHTDNSNEWVLEFIDTGSKVNSITLYENGMKIGSYATLVTVFGRR